MIEEIPDPDLNPILVSLITLFPMAQLKLKDSLLNMNPSDKNEQQSVIIGEQLLSVDPNFKLLLTSQQPNPKFSPVVFIKTTVINFIVT